MNWPLLLLACAGSVETKEPPPAPEDSGSSPLECEDPCETPSTASTEQFLDASVFSYSPERTRENPLKGLMTSYLWGEPANDFPDQLEFLYLPMAALWSEHGDTLESGLEPYLVAAGERGHHAVIRVYLDYPSKESGLPEYLADQVSCEPYSDHGGGCSPDYDDPDLVEAMLGLIAAMGARYDADPRLGFVQLGLLGFWGEWHTWPYSDWFPTEETQEAVLSAYETAFSTTHLQVRTPAGSSVSMRIGYHDDSFAYSTLGDIDWFFLPGLESAGAQDRWQEVPIGGEIRPELQPEIFESGYETDTYAQDIFECIEATHASYLLNYQAFNENGVGYSGEERERAEDAALALGYQLELQAATLSATALLGDTAEVVVTVQISQSGVAPFYYPLYLSLDSEALASPTHSTDDLQALLPGESRTVSLELGRVSVDLLHAPMTLQLSSPILQTGQVLEFATESPWTPEAGALTLDWSLGCESESIDFVPVGDVAGTTPDGCDCVCDVDGQFRACGREDCG